jgi:uncharacterized iron-regulated protein
MSMRRFDTLEGGEHSAAMRSSAAVALVLVLLPGFARTQAAAPEPQQPVQANPNPVASGYVPERVFDTGRRVFSDFEVMLADLARADVLIVGEQHDDPNTHRLEAALLEGLRRRKVPVTLSLEMFERDVQGALDDYLAGRITEERFLAAARPWPRYAADYRPLVELARAHEWPVVAANVPRRHAAEVAREGLGALDALPAEERAHAARDLQCPLDAYYQRFAETMSAHSAPASEQTSPDEARARTERYYFSQCLKDETMAESIALAVGRADGRPGTVVHYTGAFHSDFGLGTVERVRRRLPGRRIAFLSIVPTTDIDNVRPPDEDLKRAEYLVYTVK